jgi:hypothetical protein
MGVPLGIAVLPMGGNGMALSCHLNASCARVTMQKKVDAGRAQLTFRYKPTCRSKTAFLECLDDEPKAKIFF